MRHHSSMLPVSLLISRMALGQLDKRISSGISKGKPLQSDAREHMHKNNKFSLAVSRWLTFFRKSESDQRLSNRTTFCDKAWVEKPYSKDKHRPDVRMLLIPWNLHHLLTFHPFFLLIFEMYSKPQNNIDALFIFKNHAHRYSIRKVDQTSTSSGSRTPLFFFFVTSLAVLGYLSCLWYRALGPPEVLNVGNRVVKGTRYLLSFH